MTRPFDEWARQTLIQEALHKEFAILAVALERVIAQHRKVLPDSGGTAICAECGQDRWDKRLCGTLQTLADALNWHDGQLSQLPGAAQSSQVRRGDATTEIVFDPIRPQVWRDDDPNRFRDIQAWRAQREWQARRFEDWVHASGQVPDPQSPGSDERDAGVRPGSARDAQAGGDAYLPAGSGAGPEQAGGSEDQGRRRIRFGWFGASISLRLPSATERTDEEKENP